MQQPEVVLIIEDEPDAVLLLQHAFTKAGVALAFQSVGDGDAAVEYLSGDGVYADRALYPIPQLILLDWKLPKRSGLQVLQWIRAHEELKTLPVVVLTSSKDRGDVRRAYEAGANSYLAKPTSLRLLTEIARAIHSYWIVHNEKPFQVESETPTTS
jgi:DNA-binding response OmpR family regulator